MIDTKSEFKPKDHRNLDNVFLKIVKFSKGERIAIQGIKDISIIPSISQKLKDDNLVAIVSSEKKSANELSNYIKEYKIGYKFIPLLWNLDNITKLKDEQFHLIALIGIEQLKKDPIAYLSSYLRLLKENGKLMIIMEENSKNDLFLKKLLYENNKKDTNSFINYTQKRNIDPIREIKKDVDIIQTIQKKYNISRKKAAEIKQKLEIEKVLKNPPKSPYEIKPSEDQSFLSKSWEVLTNPATAASYWLNDQRIPDNFSKGERNNLDIATDLFNPFGIVDSAKNTVKETISLPKNLYNGEYGEAGSNFLNAGLNTLSVIPALRELKGTKGLNKELENINPSLVDDFSESFGLLGRSAKRFTKTLPIKLLPGHSNRAERALELGNNWNRDWYNNPITQDRLNNIINHSNFLERIDWKNMQEAIKDEAYISHFQSNLGKINRFLDGKSHFHNDNKGFSITGLKESLDPNAPLNKNGTQSFVDKYRPPSEIKLTAIHEGNHNLYSNDSFSGTIFSSMLNKKNPKPLRNIPADKLAEYDEYLSIPEEIYARIQEIRAENKLAPGELLTDKMVDEIFNKGLSGKSNVDSRFYQLIDKDKFKRVVNVVPAVGAVGIGAATVSEKKLGGYRESLDNISKKFL